MSVLICVKSKHGCSSGMMSWTSTAVLLIKKLAPVAPRSGSSTKCSDGGCNFKLVTEAYFVRLRAGRRPATNVLRVVVNWVKVHKHILLGLATPVSVKIALLKMF